MEHLYETVNANTTQTIVDAGKAPGGSATGRQPADVVMGKMMSWLRRRMRRAA